MTVRKVAVRRRKPGRIESSADIRTGVAALTAACPFMARAHALTGDPPLRRYSGDYPDLARIIVSQQLSTASANAIYTRLFLAVDLLEPRELLGASDAVLKGAGLSAAKIATLRAMAQAAVDGQLDLDALSDADEAEVRTRLTAVRGIGPWTADVYLMFCRGDADGFASGDLALQLATQHLLALDERPRAQALIEIAERWRPWRAVAARLLWAYYGHVKSGAPAADETEYRAAARRASRRR